MKTTPTRRRAGLAALAVVPLVIGLLAGCSSAGAGGDDKGGDKTPPASSQKYTDMEEWQLALNSCLAEKGIDMPAPEKVGNGYVVKPPTGVSDDVLAAANKECQQKIGEPPVAEGDSAGPDADRTAVIVAYYKCLNDAGYDVEMPKPGQAAGTPGVPADVIQTCAEQTGY